MPLDKDNLLSWEQARNEFHRAGILTHDVAPAIHMGDNHAFQIKYGAGWSVDMTLGASSKSDRCIPREFIEGITGQPVRTLDMDKRVVTATPAASTSLEL